MLQFEVLREKIFDFEQEQFDKLAWEVYQFQYYHNAVYRNFVVTLNRKPKEGVLESIPFLPVELFKQHKVLCDPFQPSSFFESSGTTGSINSRHYITDVSLYERAFSDGFKQFYGEPSDWVIMALLPSYAERPNASLVYMVNHWMALSGQPENGHFLYNYDVLSKQLNQTLASGKKVLLIGVTFALLEWAKQYPGQYPGLTIIETGGMKGRGKELVRDELHTYLNERLYPDAIHSEYGMTELFSQAYSQADGVFRCIPTMRVLRRDPYDPLNVSALPGRGLLNIIDLANLGTCSFIAVQDVGKLYADGSFEVLGRSDNSDTRGCNLMMDL
jgi:hypothetical protein